MSKYNVTVTYKDDTDEGFISSNCYANERWFIIHGDGYSSFIPESAVKNIHVENLPQEEVSDE